jgi:hypothetical protein
MGTPSIHRLTPSHPPRAWAHAYLECGYAIVPLEPNSLVPFDAAWRSNEFRSHEQVNLLFGRHPDAGIACKLGRSGLWGVRIEGSEGAKNFVRWQMTYGLLSSDAVITSHDSRTLLFSALNCTEFHNDATLFGSGIRLLAGEIYVALPPTTALGRGVHTWDTKRNAWDCVGVASGNTLRCFAQVLGPRRAAQYNRSYHHTANADYVDLCDYIIPGDVANIALGRIARSLRIDRKIGMWEGLELLKKIAATRFDPPINVFLNEAEFQGLIADALAGKEVFDVPV